MATYQEQIAERAESKARKAIVSCAELAKINDGLALLVRDGIFTNEERFTFIKAFVLKHPEINEAIARQCGDGERS